MTCPHCGTRNRPDARYCSECGQPVTAVNSQPPAPGRIPHPRPLDRPAGYDPVRAALDLYYHWESAWGGPAILGTEGLSIRVFNTGYPLEEVTLRIHGTDAKGGTLFTREERVPSLSQGGEAVLEVASYELAVPALEVAVSLISAEFGPESEKPS